MSENKLINAYNNMVKHLHDALQGTTKTLTHGLEIAKEKTSEVGGLTQEELNKVSDYVKRDVEDAAHALNDKSNDALSEWFKFDLELIENFALDAFMSVADKTRLGEIAGPGTFTCMQCGKELNFKTTSAISECPECGGGTFQRS